MARKRPASFQQWFDFNRKPDPEPETPQQPQSHVSRLVARRQRTLSFDQPPQDDPATEEPTVTLPKASAGARVEMNGKAALAPADYAPGLALLSAPMTEPDTQGDDMQFAP